MKPSFHLLLVLAATCITVRAQTSDVALEPQEKIRYQLILPDEKTPEVVKPNEPNPFNKGDLNTAKTDDSTSEENRVKDILKNLGVSGIKWDRDHGNVTCVMLGDMRLERNMTVPPVLPDQTVFLRVNSLSDTAIEMFWIEKKKRSSLVQRTPFIIPINLKATVRTAMPSIAPPEPAKGGPGKSFLIVPPRGQSMPDSPPLAAPEARRATIVDESGATDQASAPPTTKPETDAKKAPPDQQQAKGEEHPANMLLNLFLNKGTPAQQPVK
jgi:hypothetical protein